MLREKLITERTLQEGVNVFVYNSYAIWITKFSHLYFFFFFNIKSSFNFSSNIIFLIFFCGFAFILFFFCMSWYSCYKFIRRVLNEDLMEDEEINPSILNEIVPQIFFSLCNFFLINLLYVGHLLVYLNLKDDFIFIPFESLFIFFLFFAICIFYAIFFKYENSTSVFILGLNGIVTLSFFILREKYIFLPSLLCSGYYLIYKIIKYNKNKFLYHIKEENYMKILLYGCSLTFVDLLLKNFNLIDIQLFSFFLLISYIIFVYSDLNLQKMEILYESIENRILYTYVSSFQLNNKMPGKP
ncbi:hypothetical protein CYL21_4977 [Plasmodium falciparum NF54]|uniref:Uncharacterized protein n=2 Tax=Plasmodium falciparum TaxID=5833 RepID=A0A143ZVX7_PLAF7|nr:conserved Plasmodium membrane protein, unknown function [Plasmodium falciparum 3D7]KAF4326690.1 hypothetical protein CYL21_4977 [Plasmodium falciparum NF54]PKC42276.1 hypothetical protein CK202_5515 [Plasmodium falciparum NF54]CZT62672.1 conserved Plasmodium membrane protein, unknown function [Plasmodium falciparum 3D7]SOS77728.1 conserved Plasmodium membrane protein, unknown function [Plasmodium sp. gorilla clade G1]|eukprot:XP_024329044.1 conserved Plasmodium membrane protein, unknown function [Plasmodium falciparum 3D7]